MKFGLWSKGTISDPKADGNKTQNKTHEQFACKHQSNRQNEYEKTCTCHHQDSSEVLKCHAPSEPSLECAVLVLISVLILEPSALSDRAH